MWFIELSRSLSKKLRSSTIPLSGSPAVQTSLSTSPRVNHLHWQNLTSPIAVVSLPDELILSILSHVSPDPQHSDHFTRFRVQYDMRVNEYHRERTRFLKALSMTCKVMRLRLIPWIWERLEVFSRQYLYGEPVQMRRFKSLLNTLKGDVCLAIAVR